MMERLEARLSAIALSHVDGAIERLASRDLPKDVEVARSVDGVILSGRRLSVRAIEDARLRGFALGARR